MKTRDVVAACARAGVVLWVGLLAAVPAVSDGKSKLPAPPASGVLTPIASHVLSVSEPSDLTIDDTGRTLWTVTDKPGRVHQLSLDGKLIKTLGYSGDDLEGIAYDPSDRTLWVAEEARREIVHIDLEGNVLSRHPLGLTGEKNSGLEGLCLDAQGRMFALNEKKPGLFLELDSKRSIARTRELSFAGDYSGITYDRKRDGFWIVSDQSQRLYLCDRTANVLKNYPLPYTKAEGVAVDEVAGRIYIVSDSDHRLYVYRLEH